MKFKILNVTAYNAGKIYTYNNESYFSISNEKFIKLDEELSIYKNKEKKELKEISYTFTDKKLLDIVKRIPNKYILSKKSEKEFDIIIHNLFYQYYNKNEDNKAKPLFINRSLGIYINKDKKLLLKINFFDFISLEGNEVIQVNEKLDAFSYELISISKVKEIIVSLEKIKSTFTFEKIDEDELNHFIYKIKTGLKSREDAIQKEKMTIKEKRTKENKYYNKNIISLVKNFIISEEHTINLKLVSAISYIKGIIHLNCGGEIYKFDIEKEQFLEIQKTFLSLGEEDLVYWYYSIYFNVIYCQETKLVFW